MTSSDDSLVTEQADVLSEEELASAYERWEAPRMATSHDVADDEKQQLLNLEALEALQEQAREEGFKAGYEEGRDAGYKAGLESGQKEIQEQLGRLESVFGQLNQPLDELDQQIENDFIQLLMLLCRQFLGRELKQNPELVVSVVREAMAALPVNERQLRVFLHPDDLSLVKSGLSLDKEDGSGWQWQEDPNLTRGGVRLETTDTSIDASVETRLQRLIESLLDGEPEHGE